MNLKEHEQKVEGLITRQFYCELADTFATDSSSESDQKGLQERYGRVL